jgi:putative oxidoreductase
VSPTIAAGLLLLRLVFGLTVAAHGAQKLFGWFGGPGLEGFGGFLEQLGIAPASRWSWAAALAEFGGGLLVALGLLSRLGNFLVRYRTAIPDRQRHPRTEHHRTWIVVP